MKACPYKGLIVASPHSHIQDVHTTTLDQPVGYQHHPPTRPGG